MFDFSCGEFGQEPLRALLARVAASGADLAADVDVRAALLPLCARYLVGPHAHAAHADAVARFHLGNGARYGLGPSCTA
jgi:hypothetical protein